MKQIPCILVGITALALLHACMGRGGLSNSASNQTVALVQPASVYPLTYFDHRCSRCHGPQGSHYGDEFASELSDEALRHEVEEMAAGPGFEPLEGVALEAQVALHRSMMDRRPFIIWSEAQSAAWRGETLPGSEVVLRLGDETHNAEVNGFAWMITFPQEIVLEESVGPAELIARRDGDETRLDLTRAAFSHAAPLE